MKHIEYMTTKEYKEAVERTETDYAATAAYFHTTLTPENKPRFALLHGIMGICDEARELYLANEEEDRNHVMEEAGDLLWFLTITCRELGIELENVTFVVCPVNSMLWSEIMYYACSMSGIEKKTVIYGIMQEIKTSCEHYIVSILQCLHTICRSYGFTVEDAMEANVRKLKVRYPEKFTSDCALNRDTVKEMRAVEGKESK